MSHLDEAAILAARDEAATDSATRGHLGSCLPCRAALGDARRRAEAIEGLLVATSDAVDVEAAKAHVRARLDRERTRGERRARGRHLRRAAAILLICAGTAYALPRTPIGSWLRPGPAEGPASGQAQGSPEGQGAAPTTAEDQQIVLVAVAEAIDVVLDEVAPGTEVEVEWLEGSTARIAAGPGARYSVGDGVVRASAPNGPVRIWIPRATPMISITINGRMVYEGTSMEARTSQVVTRSDEGVVFLASVP